jgi:hypothetical protein
VIPASCKAETFENSAPETLLKRHEILRGITERSNHISACAFALSLPCCEAMYCTVRRINAHLCGELLRCTVPAESRVLHPTIRAAAVASQDCYVRSMEETAPTAFRKAVLYAPTASYRSLCSIQTARSGQTRLHCRFVR